MLGKKIRVRLKATMIILVLVKMVLIKKLKKQVIQKAALDELNTIMRLRDISQVQYKFNEYFSRWTQFGKLVWVEYLKNEYYPSHEKWVDAYRLYEHQEMNTTNFVEA